MPMLWNTILNKWTPSPHKHNTEVLNTIYNNDKRFVPYILQNVYVNSDTGNNNNDGRTPETALATLSQAMRWVVNGSIVSRGDNKPYKVVINLAGNTHFTLPEQSDATFYLNGKVVEINGNSIATLDVPNFYSFMGPGYIYLQNLNIEGTGLGFNMNCSAKVMNCVHNLTVYKGIFYGVYCSSTVILDNTTLTMPELVPGTTTAQYAKNGVAINYGSSVIFSKVTIQGAYNPVINVYNGGMAQMEGTAFTTNSSATGKRYSLTNNSFINTKGKGADAIPGSIAGTVDATSTYL